MIAKIEQLLKEVEALHASNAEELEALRIKYLSKKGAINDLMADFRNVAAEQKKEVGMRLNDLNERNVRAYFQTYNGAFCTKVKGQCRAGIRLPDKRKPACRREKNGL